MANFVAYRDGGGRIEGRIRQAVGQFYSTRGVLPVSIAVNERELDEARLAVDVLGLRLPVQALGGTLVPEVWLQEVEG